MQVKWKMGSVWPDCLEEEREGAQERGCGKGWIWEQGERKGNREEGLPAAAGTAGSSKERR